MKTLMSILIPLRLVALFFLGVASAVAAEPAAPSITVSYNKVNDHLSVSAEASSLKLVLSQIALQSGIEVLFDDVADEPLSIDIPARSLEKALEQLLRGSNHIKRYNKDSKGNHLLVGVMVLPSGQSDSASARPLLDQEKEAYHYARKETHNSTSELDDERWQARLAEMPDELRERLDQKVSERQAEEEKREQQRVQQKEQMTAEKEEAAARRAERQQSRQEMLDSLSPERRAIFEQGAELAREQLQQ